MGQRVGAYAAVASAVIMGVPSSYRRGALDEDGFIPIAATVVQRRDGDGRAASVPPGADSDAGLGRSIGVVVGVVAGQGQREGESVARSEAGAVAARGIPPT